MKEDSIPQLRNEVSIDWVRLWSLASCNNKMMESCLVTTGQMPIYLKSVLLELLLGFAKTATSQDFHL